MTPAERAERLMRKHLGVVPPWDRPWKRRGFEMILESLPEIGVFEAMGLNAIMDEERRWLIWKYVNGEKDHEHAGFNVWLLDRCLGDRGVPPEIFHRCRSCQKVRTWAGTAHACPCGSRSTFACGQNISTNEAFGRLVLGY